MPVYLLDIRDTLVSLEKYGEVTDISIRNFFTQRGFQIQSVAPKPSGTVVLTADGEEAAIEAAWKEYEPSAVNPALSSGAQILRLQEIRGRILQGFVTDRERDEALTLIINLALLSYGIVDDA